MTTLTFDDLGLGTLRVLLLAPPPDTVGRVERLPDAAEREVLDGLSSGDPEALNRLYREYGDAVRRLVIEPRLRRRDQALDLLQETFLTAARKAREFRWKGVGFFPWLRAIALGQLRNHARAQGREVARRVPLEDALPWLASGDDTLARVEVRERITEIRLRLREAMATLKPRDRQVVKLRLLERRTSQEAAEAVGVTPAHLDVLLYRALRRLRKAYEATEQEVGRGR